MKNNESGFTIYEVMSQPPIHIILLAAGLSRRMGIENKLLLPFNQATIVETTVAEILKADIGRVTIVLGHEAEAVKTQLGQSVVLMAAEYPPLSYVFNEDYALGMTTSIQAGVRSVTEGGAIMVCLADMPLIQADVYRSLSVAFYDFYKNDKKAIVQPTYKGKRGNPVIFSDCYKKAILDLPPLSSEGEEGCRPIVKAHRNHVYTLGVTTSFILKDIDVKEDYWEMNQGQ